MPKIEKNILWTKNRDEIIEYLDEKSDFLIGIASEKSDEILFIRKIISHSDIPFAKRTDQGDAQSKNLLYYFSDDDAAVLGLDEVAHQTSINPGAEFFKFLNLPVPSKTRGVPRSDNLAKMVEIFLVNDENLHYFTRDYTTKIITKLDKTISKQLALKLLSFQPSGAGELIKIDSLHLSAHGFGVAGDEFFHALRANIFKGDFLNILMTKKDGRIKIYFLLEKNPRFFTLINETNAVYEKFLNNKILKEISKINQNPFNQSDEKSRRYQNAWREKLADESIAYTKSDKIICPISQIQASRDNFLTLFRASHIKRYEASDIKEAFDINNGLLLAANIDALFDKFLISIDENRELKLSFLFVNEGEKLLDDLRIHKAQKIPAYFLNDKRMEYLSWHFNQFCQKEAERKC